MDTGLDGRERDVLLERIRKVARVHAGKWDLGPEGEEELRERVLESLARYCAKSLQHGAPPPEEALLHFLAEQRAMKLARHFKRFEKEEIESEALAEIPDPEPGVEEIVHRLLLMDVVRAMLANVSREQRDLFLGHYQEGKTLQELAKEEGMNLRTVQSQLRRLRERILRALQLAGYEEPTAGCAAPRARSRKNC